MRKFIPDSTGAKAWLIAKFDGEKFSTRRIALVGWEVWSDEDGRHAVAVTHPAREFYEGEDGSAIREQVVIKMPGSDLWRTIGGYDFDTLAEAVADWTEHCRGLGERRAKAAAQNASA